MNKICYITIIAALLILAFVGCAKQPLSEKDQVKKENMPPIINEINDHYYNLSNTKIKEITFNVKSSVMTNLLSKIKKEKNLEFNNTTLIAVWDSKKIKSLRMNNPIRFDDATLNLSVAKMSDSVKKGLNSILKLFYSYNGDKLIKDASKVQKIYKTKDRLIVEKKSDDITVREKLYFDNKYKLLKSILYKKINGREKKIFEFFPQFENINSKYVLKEIHSTAKTKPLTTNIKYSYSSHEIIVFPAIIEYTFITDRVRYNELFEITEISLN